MNINSFIIKQVLRQLSIPASAVKHLELTGALSDVEGKGFPWDLIQLNAPMITRGLLNFATIQMNRDWIYPYWVQKQLDPNSGSYIPRSQNPLLINVTHRNWTTLGSPYGYHEAIVDPRGLVTPLPREWSIDVWLVTSKGTFYPSLSDHVQQQFDTIAPRVQSIFTYDNIRLELETFVHSTRRGIDIVFHRATAMNISEIKQEGYLCFALRPFNPEGVAPIQSVEFKSPRIAYINKTVGVVFAEDPDGIACSTGIEGDTATMMRNSSTADGLFKRGAGYKIVSCKQGLAHATAGFHFNLHPDTAKIIHCSAALGTEEALRKSPVKQTWRVSFDHRHREQHNRWVYETLQGARITIADKRLQNLFDACRLTLLQLHDGDFISPGPYIYHKFWFRDAAVMLTALDVIGFPKRTARVIDTFIRFLTNDGFFRGPDGEWDSNGAVIWTIYRHYELNRSELWLREWYPVLVKAAGWIQRMRRKTRDTATTAKGLMPKSLSAEHLGMVDQYYWDSFWSLAGLQCMGKIAAILGKQADEIIYGKEAEQFANDIIRSFGRVEKKNGEKIIPASPVRQFDESAIGSVCAVYPLQLFDENIPHGRNTLRMLAERYIDEKGFFHPLIHSGYNPYLTLHIAHGLLLTGDTEHAWEIADAVFKQATSTYTYPEAIHPVTGGGTMGDGHHGWAAAEIVMFIRNCLFMESGDTLRLFSGGNGRLMQRNVDCSFKNIPTLFGRIGVEVRYTSSRKCTISFSNKYFKNTAPGTVEIHLPFEVSDVVVGKPDLIDTPENRQGRSILRIAPEITKLYVTMK